MKSFFLDVVALAGLSLAGYGVYKIYQPAMFIFVGIVLLSYAIMSALRSDHDAP